MKEKGTEVGVRDDSTLLTRDVGVFVVLNMSRGVEEASHREYVMFETLNVVGRAIESKISHHVRDDGSSESADGGVIHLGDVVQKRRIIHDMTSSARVEYESRPRRLLLWKFRMLGSVKNLMEVKKVIIHPSNEASVRRRVVSMSRCCAVRRPIGERVGVLKVARLVRNRLRAQVARYKGLKVIGFNGVRIAPLAEEVVEAKTVQVSVEMLGDGLRSCPRNANRTHEEIIVLQIGMRSTPG